MAATDCGSAPSIRIRPSRVWISTTLKPPTPT